MALTQQFTQPSQLGQQLGQDYATQLTGLTSVPLDTSKFAPSVAAQDPLQTQAASLAGQGVGSYQPHLTQAGAYGTQAGTTMGGVSPYITGAAGLTGPGAGTGAGSIAEYMSPYQQQVIDATLGEFDIQAQKGLTSIGTQAVGAGAYGGGRHGVAEAEYQTQSDRNRAALYAGLQQQGFGQAQQARQQDLLNQMGISQAQLGLGQYQTGLAGTQQAMAAADISNIGRVGAVGQAQTQAELDAIREANRLAAYEPLERLGIYGTGVTGLMGGYPAQYQFTSQPNPTPLQSALGIGATLGGIYGNVMGPMRGSPNR